MNGRGGGGERVISVDEFNIILIKLMTPDKIINLCSMAYTKTPESGVFLQKQFIAHYTVLS